MKKLLNGVKYLFSFRWLRKKAPTSDKVVVPPSPRGSSQPRPMDNEIFADISKWRVCDFDKFNGTNLIFKATEGTSIVDRTLDKNLTECKNRGIKYGVYHFYRAGVSPIAQADYFIEMAGLGNLKTCAHLPIVDFETARGQDLDRLKREIKHLKLFIKHVNGKTGRKMRIYSGEHAMGAFNFDAEFLELCGEPWIARYPSSGKPDRKFRPRNYKPWKRYWAWQFSDKYPIEGIGPCDGNQFNRGAQNEV